ALLEENAGWILKMNPIEHLDIARYLKEASLKLSADQLEKLQLFHAMLRKENERINVTRLYGADSMGRKHYVDSLLPLKLLEEAGLPLESPCMDLGSGGGFPGIPIAIARPELKMRLVEGRRKRTEFLEAVKRKLNLKNVEIVSRKLNPADQIHCKTAISRAFMSIEDTLELSALSVIEGGTFVFWKGPECEEEMEAASNLHQWKLERDLHYVLPGTRDSRRLLVYRRVGEMASRVVSEDLQTDSSDRGTASVDFLSDRTGLPGALHGNLQIIESEANPRYKDWQKLEQSKWIRKLGRTIISGRKLVPEFIREALQARADTSELAVRPLKREDSLHSLQGRPEAVLFADTFPSDLLELASALKNLELPLIRLKNELFRRLDSSGTHFPLLLWNLEDISIPGLEDRKQSEAESLPQPGAPQATAALVLPLSNPDNLGAAIRTATAFGISQVILTAESVYPFHPLVVRSSAGTSLRMRYLQTGPVKDLNDELNGAGFGSDSRILLHQDGKHSLYEMQSLLKGESTVCFVLGQEGPGLPDKLQGLRLRIPIAPGVESLNAVASLTALLYEWRRPG
ncbi:MAG: 16S rRNA (guanine(527)-N(7))-methyltransferase RsmG, partial [Leptospiraceae bacterium]|nr:16S rRNA (guanine(527)-N(7))-methyltransferase RsmG [Leptospiraceae bacterium]